MIPPSALSQGEYFHAIYFVSLQGFDVGFLGFLSVGQ